MIEGCAVSIGSTGPLDAGVAAGVVGQLAVLDVGTVVVLDALQDRRTNTCTTKQFTSRALNGDELNRNPHAPCVLTFLHLRITDFDIFYSNSLNII